MGRIMVFRELEDCYAFFSHDASCTDIYTLSLHDALPIWKTGEQRRLRDGQRREVRFPEVRLRRGLDAVGLVAVDRKSTRLNCSHSQISYAVFCLKKKRKKVFLEREDGYAVLPQDGC